MVFMNRFEFPYFADFFVRFLKPEKGIVFFKILAEETVNEMEQKTRVSC